MSAMGRRRTRCSTVRADPRLDSLQQGKAATSNSEASASATPGKPNYERCAGSYEMEKCRAEEERLASETPEQAAAKRKQMEGDRAKTSTALASDGSQAMVVPGGWVCERPTIRSSIPACAALASRWLIRAAVRSAPPCWCVCFSAPPRPGHRSSMWGVQAGLAGRSTRIYRPSAGKAAGLALPSVRCTHSRKGSGELPRQPRSPH
jgi:hypothetical protein